MKKLTYIFAMALSVSMTSCNNDDGVGKDLLIGNWQLIQEFENGQLIETEPCDLEEILQFNADNSFQFISFEDDGTGTCVELFNEEGIWRNNSNNEYTFSSITSFDGQPSTKEVLFEGNTFSIEYTETFNEESTEFREVYIRN